MNTKTLTEIMTHASKYALSWKSDKSLPILKYALFKIDFGNLTIATTNLEHYFIITIPDTDETDVEGILPAQPTADLLKRLDQNEETYFEMAHYQKDYKTEPVNHETYGKEYTWKDTLIEGTYLVLSNANSLFYFKQPFPIDEFPPNSKIAEYPEETITLKSGLIAGIYKWNTESELDEYDKYKAEKKQVNKLFPKYLKIDEEIYQRSKDVCQDYDYSTHPSKPKSNWYCFYSNGQKDQKITLHELENYDTINLK